MHERYERQIRIPTIGESGQQKLSSGRVLVIGAGGLGSPVLYYLCAAGIGTLGIADFDYVSPSNLNRQILHTEADIGHPKTESAMRSLSALNADVKLHAHREELTAHNIQDILSGYDIVVDCVDAIETRLMVARACLRQGLPLVEAGIEGFCGFVMSTKPGFACLSCMLGAIPQEQKRSIPVSGATAGVAGSLQAAECIKLLLGIGEPLLNRALFFDLLSQSFDIIDIQKSNKCAVCGQSAKI